MKSKKLTIDTCGDCPHFGNVYYSYEEKCKKLNRKIKNEERDGEYRHWIPNDCPLPDADAKPFIW